MAPKACIRAYKKLVSSLFRKEMTALFMLTSVANHLPVRCCIYFRKRWKSLSPIVPPRVVWLAGIYRAPFLQSDLIPIASTICTRIINNQFWIQAHSLCTLSCGSVCDCVSSEYLHVLLIHFLCLCEISLGMFT